jgi:catechol 2,3-dioxygenase-like lactoylglutathione lyase family enzyme
MQPAGVDHIILTISDAARSRAFYRDVLGFPVRDMPGDPPSGIRFVAGGVEFFLYAAPDLAAGDRFDEGRIGLDHIAWTAPSRAALDELAERLRAGGVATNGVEQFAPTGNYYVAFRDPDNIQLEYWLP